MSEPHPQCGAKTKRGKPCKQVAGARTDHPGVGRCWVHGGASPQAQFAGVVELARREAAVMGAPLSIEPHEAILECIRIAAGEVRYASERIAELDQEAAVGPVTTRTIRPLKGDKGADHPTERVVETQVGAPAVNIWVAVRHKAMDRLVAYSQAALKAGVEERQVQIAERQGQMLADVIQRVLVAAGIADRPDIPGIVRRELTLVAGA